MVFPFAIHQVHCPKTISSKPENRDNIHLTHTQLIFNGDEKTNEYTIENKQRIGQPRFTPKWNNFLFCSLQWLYYWQLNNIIKGQE